MLLRWACVYVARDSIASLAVNWTWNVEDIYCLLFLLLESIYSSTNYHKTTSSNNNPTPVQQQVNNKSTTSQQQVNNKSITSQQQVNNKSTTSQQQVNNKSTSTNLRATTRIHQEDDIKTATSNKHIFA
ncbi:hypothetical protein Vi05172_g6731 [Venturia inaequalis]|nr:hypothetical protein Vi05172_g6731 [Venturia inaequalis]